ncbi:MAG: MFS transporter [Acidobacteriota bacterium]|nr:MFS transporter [Blastocatellia bacterium]MDW8412791.1 MFS transporter [Acidobacteriota bacterium]
MKRFFPIFVVVFIDLLGFSIILPLLPYYASIFQATPTTIGLLIATYSIFQFIASPLLGSLSDKYGRKPLLLYSQIGSLIGFLLLASAGSLPYPLVWLFVARAIDGLSGGNITVAQAYISDITSPEERAKSFGLILGLAFGFSFLIGTGLGGFLSRYGYTIPAYVAAFFSLCSIISTLLILPETQNRTAEERKIPLLYLKAYTNIDNLRRLYYVFFLFSLFFSLFVTTFALYADRQLHLTAEQAGYTLAGVGLLGIIWQGGIVGPLVKRLGERNALLVGMLSSTTGYFSILLVDEWWKLSFAAVFISFGNGTIRPSLMSLLTQLAPPQQRGGALGVAASIESLSRIAAPILGGWIVGSLYPSWIGLASGLLAATALFVSMTISAPEEPGYKVATQQ